MHLKKKGGREQESRSTVEFRQYREGAYWIPVGICPRELGACDPNAESTLKRHDPMIMLLTKS